MVGSLVTVLSINHQFKDMKTVVVVGGGVAGLQAGVFTSKAGEDTVVLDTDETLVYSTSNIQNLIGHESITGKEIINSGREKLEDFGGEYIEEEVEKVEKEGEEFKITTNESEYRSKYVIVASAGSFDFLESLDISYEEGVEGPYMMEKHIVTDSSNKAEGIENLYVAGLSNSWEYQTSTALGDGAKAAVNLLTDLYGEPYTDHDT